MNIPPGAGDDDEEANPDNTWHKKGIVSGVEVWWQLGMN
jgi:hypothetical protein